MTIAIRSKLIHDAGPGEGIRAFISSSADGQLLLATIHRKSIDLGVDALAVKAGDTIDFLVDIGKVLNSDQYLWTATLTELAAAGPPTVWNSQTDFPRDLPQQLSRWEQLAQVLLCSNEFLFVD
jgi:hypothetical protein